jgi:hypothetical protein
MTSVAVSLKVGGWVPMLRWTRSASRPAVTTTAKLAHRRARDDRESALLDDGF